jgi:hypothetical protein
MTSRQATFSPRLSRYLSRVSHLGLPLSSVRRPVSHAKRAKNRQEDRGLLPLSTAAILGVLSPGSAIPLQWRYGQDRGEERSEDPSAR